MANLGGAASDDKPLQKLSSDGFGQGHSEGGYDAARGGNGRRRQVAVNLKAEDWVLRPWDRDRVISHTRTLKRNASIVAWGIRKHLDYNATFSFQCRSGNKAVDREVESLMNWWSRPLNCDLTGRHSLSQLTRLIESLAVTDGDVFVLKLKDGRIQVIEGDRVRTPTNMGDALDYAQVDGKAYIHGVRADDNGRPISYAVCDREGNFNGFVLRSIVKAQYIYQHGYFDRYDQLRGVSPLASAINSFCDLYEAQEYALAKMKLSQLFALKMNRNADTQSSDPSQPYNFNFGGGPQLLDLDPGDDASFMESATPSDQFQAFMEKGIAIGLKALDIPYSFYDESHTNYSGARQALLQYEQSCQSKRDRLQQLLTNLTVWRLGLFIADGQLTLPDGWTMDDLTFDWIPAPLPWIDPVKDVTAQAMMISNKLTTRSAQCKENGEDFFQIVDQLAQEEAYMKSKGLSADTVLKVSPPNGAANGNNDDATDPANENGDEYNPDSKGGKDNQPMDTGGPD